MAISNTHIIINLVHKCFDSILWAQSIISLETDLCQDIKEDSIIFAFIKRMDFGSM